jgi:hypothetical protein
VSPLRLRPEVRIPWWLAVAIAAASYLVASALRGWDFRPTWLDLLVFAGLAGIVALRFWLVARIRAEEEAEARQDDSATHDAPNDSAPGSDARP